MTRDNVLIVDDEEDILLLLSETVTRWGYNPIVAQNGTEALDKARNYPIDCMLTDLRMPGPDGIELLNEVKKIDPATSVIVFTGYPGVDSAVDALKAGAEDYLSKPVDFTELRKKISSAIDQKRARNGANILGSLNWGLLISIPIWLITMYFIVQAL